MHTLRHCTALASLAVTLALGACAGREPPTAPETIMDMEPKSFLGVPLNSNERHECSPPEPSPDWRGIVIRAPRVVHFAAEESSHDADDADDADDGHGSAFAAVPICGYYFVDAASGPDERMTIVAVDVRSRKVYSGAIVELDPSPEEPPPEEPPPSAEDLAGVASGGWFNPNLLDFVALPPTSASYEVHIEFRNYKSNFVTVELAAAEAAAAL